MRNCVYVFRSSIDMYRCPIASVGKERVACAVDSLPCSLTKNLRLLVCCRQGGRREALWLHLTSAPLGLHAVTLSVRTSLEALP